MVNDEKITNCHEECDDKFDNYSLKSHVDPSDVNSIRKFCDKLPIPMIAKPIQYNFMDICKKKDNSQRYCIKMKDAYHKFHSDFQDTYIWGYDGLYPGPTIEAFKDIPVFVEWVNNLPTKHFLPFDTTLHGIKMILR